MAAFAPAAVCATMESGIPDQGIDSNILPL
jgi:hypothetical protein